MRYFVVLVVAACALGGAACGRKHEALRDAATCTNPVAASDASTPLDGGVGHAPADGGSQQADANGALPSDAGSVDAGDAASADAGNAMVGDAGPLDASVIDAGHAAHDSGIGNLDAGRDAGPFVLPVQDQDGIRLSFRIVDAEYSRALDRIVAVASDPNRLILLDPETGSFEQLALPLMPSAVSVHPNGKSALVGHDGYMTLVELAPLRKVSTLGVTAPLFDVVLGNNGYGYGFPAVGQWGSIHSIALATGAEALGPQETSIYQGTVGRLHPAGNRMYSTNGGISPSQLQRYDIATGPVSGGYSAPDFGTYAVGGNLWFSEDGARIFTAGGSVFHASDDKTKDMTYAGSLENNPSVLRLDHSAAARLVATVHGFEDLWQQPTPGSELLHLHEDVFLNLQGTLTLPPFMIGSQSYPSLGQFVFFNAAGTRLYVLVRARSDAPLVENFALVRYALDGQADEGHVISVTTDDGQIPGLAPRLDHSFQLDTSVIDAEYSRALDRIIAVQAEPNQLLVLDPRSGESASVALPLAPLAVSVSLDGLRAAVGHDGSVSTVDLKARKYADSIAVDAVTADLVLSAEYAHVSPVFAQDCQSLYSVELSTHKATSVDVWPVSCGIHLRLHPDANRMYGGGSLNRYDVSSGLAKAPDPFSLNTQTCDGVWFSEDGDRIFTACGDVLKAANWKGDDMTPSGTLAHDAKFASVDHSITAGLIAVASSRWSPYELASPEVRLFESQYLRAQEPIALSNVMVSGVSYNFIARHVFFRADGSELYVLVDVDPNASSKASSHVLTYTL